eukprot:TRINITY_DN241_c0_g1_i1.p1 TRINITY_DN241_c0_g1~~TRINITY_DN241_c0_g1_i1.p1  ORF type:complete len:234 (-),score=56.50 TRINITY_DN241_c0_g1_i1:144-845(-)
MPQDEDLLTESFSARRKCFTVFQRITVVSNLIFALFAILLIVLGGVAVKELKEYSYMTKVTIPSGLIVLGVILAGIIFLGILGSFKKSTKLLGAYFVLLFLFIICEFGVGGGAYGLRGRIPGELEYAWGQIPDGDVEQLQWKWGCCGWANMTDQQGGNCPNATGYVPTPLPPKWVSTNISCEDLIVTFFQEQLYAVGTAGVVFATLQLLALISSIVVFVFIKVEQRRSQDERF